MYAEKNILSVVKHAETPLIVVLSIQTALRGNAEKFGLNGETHMRVRIVAKQGILKLIICGIK